MGEEQEPTEWSPIPLYSSAGPGMFAAVAECISQDWNSRSALLTETFHTLIDELTVDPLEHNITLILAGPEGFIWAVRRWNSARGTAIFIDSKTSSDFTHTVPVTITSLNMTVILSLTTEQAGPEFILLLRTIGTALSSRFENELIKDDQDSLNDLLNRSRQTIERQSTLLHLAKQLHELNDVNAILTAWINCLDLLYPTLRKQLYVSQDHLCPDIPIQPLSLYEADHICSRAFMEGRIVIAEEPADPLSQFWAAAVPLKGKQGVYGVLYLQTPGSGGFDAELDFIGQLTDTTGTAFENAQLFEQTVRLVQELQLINEITHRLNKSLKLQDIFQYAVHELTHIFHAEFACILELDKSSNELVVRSSHPEAFINEKFSLDYGFAGLVISKKEPVILSDYRSDCPIDSFWMDATNARSLLASPILDHGEPIGAILIAHRAPNYFSYNNYKLLQVLSGHIGLALTNASLHAEVRRMVATDHLTGLYTRHYLDEHIAAFQKKDVCGSLVLLDIDNFKKVNDSHGHQIGDHVLMQVSRIIKSCIRDGDIAARWGGEELAIYFPKVNREQAIHVAERICNHVRLETSPQVTVSCGISDWSWNEAKLSVETLFYRADMALYNAKSSGKNQIKQG